MNYSLNNKELVAAGHEFAKALSSDTAIYDIAKMVSRLAERLDCTTAALREMAKQRDALASQKAAPIILYRERNPYNGLATGWEELNAHEYGFVKDNASDNAEFRIVYTAPPAPVVPEDVRQALSKMDDEIIAELDADESAYRATMLQGKAERAESLHTIQTAPALDSLPIIAESRHADFQGKAEPVSQWALPEGGVAVPAEPTPEMLAEICLVDGWTERALRARYKAMLAAVPQPEVK